MPISHQYFGVMDGLLTLRVFCRVAACGSFSQAARELSLAQSAVSRGVAGLESRLGRKLFERTTRRVSLTLEGRAYFEQVEEHVRALEDAELRAVSGFDDLAGHIKLSAPGALGRRILLPEIMRVMQESPGLVVEATFTDRKLDLVSDAIDFAIRVGRRSDPSYVERELVESPQWLVASAAMLAGKRVPSSLTELAGQKFVASGSTRALSKLEPALRLTTDDLEGAFAAVRAGLGYGVLPRWLVAREVATGTLLHVLPDLTLASPPIVVVYPRRLRKAARRLLERLERHLLEQVTLHELEHSARA
jgi:DNA-binding transcriptional LysR family regulator